MLFSSFEFLFRFLPVFLVIYYLTPKKFRNVTLLGGSIVFYTIGEAGYITILLACVLVNYTADPFDVPEEYGRAGNQTETLIASCARGMIWACCFLQVQWSGIRTSAWNQFLHVSDYGVRD